VAAATRAEGDPEYDKSVPPWWRYEGRAATQYWRAPKQAGLVARVNGRRTFWATDAPIPGGVSVENFELEAPIAAGQEFRFGVTESPPEKLGFDAACRKRVTDGK
jgi:hypothetical protein